MVSSPDENIKVVCMMLRLQHGRVLWKSPGRHLVSAFLDLKFPYLNHAGGKIQLMAAQHFISYIYYRIRPNYHTYPYKRTVKWFCSFQIIACVLFVYTFLKAYVVGTHLNCINLLMQFKWVPTTYMYAFRKKNQNHPPKPTKHHVSTIK